MQQEPKISTNKIKELIKSQSPDLMKIPYEINGNAFEVTVKPVLGKDEKVQFIATVVDGCFIGDKYQPFYKTELTKIAVLEYFTNIKVEAGADILFDLVNKTDIYTKIYTKISGQIYELESVINDMIEYKKREILSTQKQELDNSLSQIEVCVSQFKAISKQFENIDVNEMFAVLKKYSDKDKDELVDSVLSVRSSELA